MLEHWLIDHDRPLPAPAELRAWGLAAYAYGVLPPDHPRRVELRGDYLQQLGRHQMIRTEILPLLRGWNRVGIEPLLFKGFHLAEFAYPAPGMRFHGDVDLLVREEEVQRAVTAAGELGWKNSGKALRRSAHCATTLSGPLGAARIDLHRLAIHSPLPWNRVQRRITREVWSASRVREWKGARIREMAPVDAILVGLVLQRCWSSDRWCLKAHDPLDLRVISERFDVSTGDLHGRARELGVSRTLSIFLPRCDGSGGRVSLERPPATAVDGWTRAVRRERPFLGRSSRLLVRLLLLPRAAREVTAVLPSLLRVHHALHRHRDMRALLAELSPSIRRRAGTEPRPDGVVLGVRWGARLLPRNPRGDCVLRALALYHALGRQGLRPHFVSGVRREGSAMIGHAWVELDGRPFPDADAASPVHFRVNFRYPAESP